jgi:serine/threonine protein kinase
MADDHLMSLQPGTVIALRYEVVKCLGAGSMGLVYACRHRELAGHLVAVKVLFPEVAQDKIAAARFRNEIFASYGVSHPNVVRAYEYIRDGDLVAYTMEYVGGGDLAERLSRPGYRMPIEEVIRILSQMCSGVQAIHDAGIVHRDLKPENILLTKDGQVKIADFGIARTGHGPKLTEHGGVVGTIDYVSPEYMLNSQVDWRSDIYAIGILGFEMITGESPFRGDSVYATMTKRLKTDPRPPSELRSECPKELDKIILRAMNRDPEKRYQAAAEMFYEMQTLFPNQALPSGALYQMARAASASYVGPAHKSVDGVPEPLGGGGDELSRVNRGGGAPIAPKIPSGFPTAANAVGKNIATDQTLQINLDGTQILNPEVSQLAKQFSEEDTIHEPIKMERVLNFGDIATSANRSPAVPTEVSLGGHYDDSRMKRLNRMVEGESRTLWFEIVVLLSAILIGVGVGVFCLKMFFPQWWPGNKDSAAISEESALFGE